MKKFINFLNGYKTLVGIFALIVLGALSILTGIDIPNFEEPQSWLDLIKMVLAAVGAVYLPVGLFDKVAKARAEDMREKLIAESPILQAAQEVLPKRR